MGSSAPSLPPPPQIHQTCIKSPTQLNRPNLPTRLVSNPNPLPIKKHLSLERTTKSFEQRPPTDVFSWTSSIARHCRNGLLPEAALAFDRMRCNGIEPNYVTFIILLSACTDFPMKAFRFWVPIHGYICKLGFDGDNVMLWTAVIGMYAKCARMDSARQVFNEMSVKNSVSWNTMIDGLMTNGEVEGAVSLFNQMPERDKISWTALIGGFVKNGHIQEALDCFREMQIAEVEPDYVTIIAVLAACADLGALGQGLWIHCHALRRDLGKNIRVCNSLIDMYSRCGCIEFALNVFEEMTTRSLVSWNSIIVGFAVNGHAEEALEHFYLLQKAGFKPDGVSFTGALTACSHAGLVEEGLRFYDTVRKANSISTRIEHYGCVVDLLSRAGRLDDALNVIESMPMKPNEVVLGSLLAACRIHGNVGLAERLMGYLVELEPNGDSNYILLSNIYASVGKWDGVGKVRKRMKALGIKKRPGFSAIEINCSIHEFVAGDKAHAESRNICDMLALLSLELNLYGYVPEVGSSIDSD